MKFRRVEPSSRSSLPELPDSQESPLMKKTARRLSFPLQTVSPNGKHHAKRFKKDSTVDSIPTNGPENEESITFESQDMRDAHTTPSLPTHLEYPVVPLPSRRVVEHYYKKAVANEWPDQLYLNQFGLLSLEVLLLSASHEENKVLKSLQAKAQRDGPPQLVGILKQCRIVVHESIEAGIQAFRQARESRRALEVQKEKQIAEERKLAREERKRQLEEQARQKQLEREKIRQIERAKRQRELKKKLPRNQELWREVVYLMTAVNDIEKQERLWKEAGHQLAAREKNIEQREGEKAVQQEAEIANQELPTIPAEPLADRVDEAVKDITVSATEIQQALKDVETLVADSQALRKDLYRKYREDHQFYGYRGVKDPKGLIRALSQSQDDTDLHY